MPAETESVFTRELIQTVYGIPFSDGNRVTLLWKNKELFRTIFDYVLSAQELICLEFYIFRNDETGTELAEVLKRKASEGVKVYIIYDHFGSFETPRKFWQDLRDSGIHIKASHPFRWTSPLRYVHRDHKKLIIIDGVRAFTGGLNIANEYRGYHKFSKVKGWRDTGIFLEGPIAGTLLDIFKRSWEIWKGEPIAFTKRIGPFDDGIPSIPIFASSSRDRRRMRKLLYYNICAARESIYITTAYFAPSIRMIRVLGDAVARGVRVRLLLPGRSDIVAAHYAGRAFFTILLKGGVEIYSYQGEILHAKTAIFDRNWSLIGSANLDFQSLRRNDEGNVGILDGDFAERMVEVFSEDLKQSEQIRLETWRARSLWERIKEGFFVIFRMRL
ncbi:MAG TPA: phospholipase D-like domain-containing protein [Thermodesulfovibrionales bacterium]|nr:phospholipase D-like domain-containing protein [Thermodesulfovibrionales bacterium]